jgi:hypothetical protein
LLGSNSTLVILGRVRSIGIPKNTVTGEDAVCRSGAARRRQLRVVRAGNGQDVTTGVFLAVLAHAHIGVGRIATNHEDCGATTALDQHRSRLTLHRLERAWNTPLPMQGTQGNAEHRHIHLRSVLCAEPDGQHLDEAHTSCAMHGFADGGARDKCRHAVVHQTGHHVTGVVR